MVIYLTSGGIIHRFFLKKDRADAYMKEACTEVLTEHPVMDPDYLDTEIPDSVYWIESGEANVFFLNVEKAKSFTKENKGSVLHKFRIEDTPIIIKHKECRKDIPPIIVGQKWKLNNGTVVIILTTDFKDRDFSILSMYDSGGESQLLKLDRCGFSTLSVALDSPFDLKELVN